MTAFMQAPPIAVALFWERDGKRATWMPVLFAAAGREKPRADPKLTIINESFR